MTQYHVRDQQASLVSMLSVLLGRPSIAMAQAGVAAAVVLPAAAALREWVGASDAARRFIFGAMARTLAELAPRLEDGAFRSMESLVACLDRVVAAARPDGPRAGLAAQPRAMPRAAQARAGSVNGSLPISSRHRSRSRTFASSSSRAT